LSHATDPQCLSRTLLLTLPISSRLLLSLVYTAGRLRIRPYLAWSQAWPGKTVLATYPAKAQHWTERMAHVASITTLCTNVTQASAQHLAATFSVQTRRPHPWIAATHLVCCVPVKHAPRARNSVHMNPRVERRCNAVPRMCPFFFFLYHSRPQLLLVFLPGNVVQVRGLQPHHRRSWPPLTLCVSLTVHSGLLQLMWLIFWFRVPCCYLCCPFVLAGLHWLLYLVPASMTNQCKDTRKDCKHKLQA
jgi:hypothetical protein